MCDICRGRQRARAGQAVVGQRLGGTAQGDVAKRHRFARTHMLVRKGAGACVGRECVTCKQHGCKRACGCRGAVVNAVVGRGRDAR